MHQGPFSFTISENDLRMLRGNLMHAFVYSQVELWAVVPSKIYICISD